MTAMKKNSRSAIFKTQKGTALMVAMLILVGITLLSLAGINTSILELRMARNAESAGSAFQTAVAATEQVLSNTSNLPATGPLDPKTAIALPATAPFICNDGDCADGAQEEILAWATRKQDCAPPPRARLASSLTSFSAFVYEAEAQVDKNFTGNGRSGLRQGYILLGPKC